MELLGKAVPVAMLAFVVSSMLAVGVSLTVGQIMSPLRNGKLVSLALLANFVLMPLSALVIARLLRLDEPLGIALLLLGTAAGASFLLCCGPDMHTAQPYLQPQSSFADRAALGDKHPKCNRLVRHPGDFGQHFVPSRRRWNRMASRRPGFRDERRPGPGYCTAEHRRCTCGRGQELR